MLYITFEKLYTRFFGRRPKVLKSYIQEFSNVIYKIWMLYRYIIFNNNSGVVASRYFNWQAQVPQPEAISNEPDCVVFDCILLPILIDATAVGQNENDEIFIDEENR